MVEQIYCQYCKRPISQGLYCSYHRDFHLEFQFLSLDNELLFEKFLLDLFKFPFIKILSEDEDYFDDIMAKFDDYLDNELSFNKFSKYVHNTFFGKLPFGLYVKDPVLGHKWFGDKKFDFTPGFQVLNSDTELIHFQRSIYFTLRDFDFYFKNQLNQNYGLAGHNYSMFDTFDTRAVAFDSNSIWIDRGDQDYLPIPEHNFFMLAGNNNMGRSNYQRQVMLNHVTNYQDTDSLGINHEYHGGVTEHFSSGTIKKTFFKKIHYFLRKNITCRFFGHNWVNRTTFIINNIHIFDQCSTCKYFRNSTFTFTVNGRGRRYGIVRDEMNRYFSNRFVMEDAINDEVHSIEQDFEDHANELENEFESNTNSWFYADLIITFSLLLMVVISFIYLFFTM